MTVPTLDCRIKSLFDKHLRCYFESDSRTTRVSSDADHVGSTLTRIGNAVCPASTSATCKSGTS